MDDISQPTVVSTFASPTPLPSDQRRAKVHGKQTYNKKLFKNSRQLKTIINAEQALS